MRHFYLLIVLSLGLFLFSEAQERCAFQEVLQRQMAENPAFAKKVKDAERNFEHYQRKTGAEQKGKPPSVTVPVIVHVLYNTPAENISDAQIQSQINVMNEDFTATNRDYRNYDAGYGDVKGDADIQFCLVQVVRRATVHSSFPANDGMKFTRRGGSDAITPMNALNIWVCDLGQGLLGYAQYPGGPAETFGVVCDYRAFGKGASYDLYPEYNLGRTMSHELGHCLGLYHIWGDRTCGNDLVGDTPLHNAANFGCPPEGHLSTCTGTPLEMWMNYMDYTNDMCMYFFTDGQVSRANFFIDNDPQIQSILTSSCTLMTNNQTITSNTNPSNVTRELNDALIVYPTIGNGLVQVEFNASLAGKKQLEIYNISGSLMMQKSLLAGEGSNSKPLDLTSLPAGMYLIKLNTESGSKHGKVIIQH